MGISTAIDFHLFELAVRCAGAFAYNEVK